MRTLTKKGINKVGTGQPSKVTQTLVNQKIRFGDIEIDAKIEHAVILNFGENSNFDSKRSACENLDYVLEPLRKELELLFTGDTEFFFQLVNAFEVRHNKMNTKRIKNEEQLEWSFTAS
jgi:hypothetical protein